MDLRKINVKYFVEKDGGLPLAPVIPVFHRWIQDDKLDDLLIDVAEYTHVHQGPGVLLIAQEANYSLDETDGRRGFLYSQKRTPEKSGEEHLRTAFRRVLTAASLLENEPDLQGELKFDPGHFQVSVNDRLAAPAGAGSQTDLEKDLKSFLLSIYGSSPAVFQTEKDPQKAVGFEVKVSNPPSISELLKKLS